MMEMKYQTKYSRLRNAIYQKAAQQQIPIHGTFELTPRCNMNCRMCYIRMSAAEQQMQGCERTAAEWIKMGEDCRDKGMLFLLLTGGEPFLRKDFREIYLELSKMGLSISINSNGTLITEETVEWLRECPPSQINITLYGSSNEIYARLCGNPMGFDQTVKAIDCLREAGILVGINGSFTKYNIDDMERIYAFAGERGIPVKGIPYMFPPVRSIKRGIADEEVRFTPEEAGEAMFRQKRCQIEPERFPEFLERMRLGMTDDTESDCCRIPDEHMGCMAGRSSFWITWDGRMLPCGMMNEPASRPFEEGFETSWRIIAEKTNKIFLPPKCKNCGKRFACMVCGAVASAEGAGDSTRTPEYMCRMVETYLDCCRNWSR